MGLGDEVLDELISSDITEHIGKAEDEILAPLLEELSKIEDQDIRQFTRALLLKATSFWYVPSSHNQEFYPPDEAMEGGLVLHTQRVFRAIEILGHLYKLDSLEHDKLKSAALLHDITKATVMARKAKPAYDYMHPYTVDGLYSMVKKDDELNSSASQSNVLMVQPDIVEHIFKAIRSHRGDNSPIPETIPAKSSLTMLLHVANEIAKSVHYIVDGDEVIIERWLEDGIQE
jgi:23S rRNA maturation-related 3'-5' exoribonuclease YhaM